MQYANMSTRKTELAFFLSHRHIDKKQLPDTFNAESDWANAHRWFGVERTWNCVTNSSETSNVRNSLVYLLGNCNW